MASQDANKPKWTLQSTLNKLSTTSPLPTTPLSSTFKALPFLHHISRLKTTPREGWKRFKIRDPESISDHMYRMAIMTMLCPPSLARRLDIPRCTQMALAHDMAECIVGDIIPDDKVLKEEKSRRERESMEFLCCGAGQVPVSDSPSSSTAAQLPPQDPPGLLSSPLFAAAGNTLKDVWQEYEDNVTNEAKFVHDIDKLELLLQMNEYERAGEGRLDLGEFSRVAFKVTLPEMREWMEQILEERVEFWKGYGGKVVGTAEEEEKVNHLDWKKMLRDMKEKEEEEKEK